jgi:hypothetical protein
MAKFEIGDAVRLSESAIQRRGDVRVRDAATGIVVGCGERDRYSVRWQGLAVAWHGYASTDLVRESDESVPGLDRDCDCDYRILFRRSIDDKWTEWGGGGDVDTVIQDAERRVETGSSSGIEILKVEVVDRATVKRSVEVKRGIGA